MRVIQLSDPHLFADPQARLCNVPTSETFRAVLEDVAQLPGGFDFIVLTGDLAQDPSLETYRALGDMLGEWRPRCRLIPGNHDNPDALRVAFPDLVPGRGPAGFSFGAEGWRVIGLDTHSPGEVGGRLDPPQLEWLARELSTDAGHVLVCLHHPPAPIGVAWLDPIGLENPEPFVQLVSRAHQVEGVCCGHVHQEFEGRLGRAAFYATPSTAFQFGHEDVERFDLIPPGYRIFELDGAGLSTRVVRLPALAFPPE